MKINEKEKKDQILQKIYIYAHYGKSGTLYNESKIIMHKNYVEQKLSVKWLLKNKFCSCGGRTASCIH